MSHSATYYDRFFMSISAGLLVTILGAGLLLAAAVWFSRRPEPFAGERPPSALWALSVAGFVIFLLGIAWQALGWVRYMGFR
jgi:hypothetical protein